MISCEWMLEIVNRAVLDWRLLIRAKAWKREGLYRVTNADKLPHRYCNFTELRQFFKGEWCALCLQMNNSSANAPRILELLEEELAEAMEKDAEREARKL